MAASEYVEPAALVTVAGVIFAATVAALVQLYVVSAETNRQRWEYRMKRRDERQATYQAAIDLLTDLGWRSLDPSFDVVGEFTVPFVRAVNSVRIYGSPGSIAAMDEIQQGFAMLNRAGNETEKAAAYEEINTGHNHLVAAAREDVGPRKDDQLRAVPFRPGAGPTA